MGVSVRVMLDTRRPLLNGEYPIKIGLLKDRKDRKIDV